MDSANTIKETGTCLELALEGERLCKCGDFASGVALFTAAIKVGSHDMRTLSAIYSQLGNAYFYLNEYEKALNYHEMDLRTAKAMCDRVGEGKASGNLGNTLKMLNRFDEAVEACQVHLQISRELGDKVGEARALYNLGNVYHTKGKQLAKVGQRDPGDLPDDVKNCLKKGAQYYRENLLLMTQMGDKSAQGRALGNLGNIHYLLGNFKDAIAFHTQRLRIAQEFGDKAAERRAHCNLGNAHVFLGELEDAIHHYHETLRLAHELQDRIMEAQACYSLGNCYTLTRDFEHAIEFHMYHLQIALELNDRMGEGRGYWSLSNALASLGRNSEALTYAKKHLEISHELKDEIGSAAASAAISDLKKLISSSASSSKSMFRTDSVDSSASRATGVTEKLSTPKLSKRFSMDHMQLLKLTPGVSNNQDEVASSNFHLNILQVDESSDAKAKDITSFNSCSSKKESSSSSIPSSSNSLSNAGSAGDENLLDLLEQCQGSRMDDQRCSLNPNGNNKENHQPSHATGSGGKGGGKAIATRNGNSVHPSNGSNASTSGNRRTGKSGMLSRSISSPVYPGSNSVSSVRVASSQASSRDSCPDEMFDLIEGIQGKRMDEQRAQLPPSRRTFLTNGPASLPIGNSLDSRPTMSQPVNLATTASTANNKPLRSSRQLSLDTNVHPDDDFFEMLMRCQGSRLEDQRSTLPPTAEEPPPASVPMLKRSSQCATTSSGTNTPPSGVSGSTVPDDDFFSLILRFQSGRIDDQRSNLPPAKSASTATNDTTTSSSSSSTRRSSKKGSKSKK